MAKWIEASITKTLQETDRVRRLWLKPNTDAQLTFKPGQFITFDLPVGEKRLQRWKSYSIANNLQDNEIEICVSLMDNGLGSRYLCKEVNVGDVLKFKGPEGVFTLPLVLPSEVVMICTGTGIAPFRSMLEHCLGNEVYAGTMFHLIFGARFETDILYRDDLAQFKKHPNFKLDIALSRYTGTGLYHKGYVHAVYLNQYNKDGEQPLFLLCGWQNMVDDARDILLNVMQMDEANIREELYG